MGTYKQASKRLVNPRPDHYAIVDGAQILVGPYTVEQRRRYMDIQMELHAVRHPGVSHAKAKEAAFMKWRMLVIQTIQDEAKT